MILQKILLGIILLTAQIAWAEPTLSIAVTADFEPTLQKIATQFQAQHQVKILISSASTGVLYAQIMHGAPYDLFLAADQQHPLLLAKADKIIPGSRATYAIGQLTLYQPNATQAVTEQRLIHFKQGKIALANPDFAPYGLAAKQTLQHMQLWGQLMPHLVFGESVSQAYGFIATGNVQMGFVALSQVQPPQPSSVWIVPQSFYSPLNQQAVLLLHAQNNPEAVAFMQFLHSQSIQSLIQRAGYGI